MESLFSDLAGVVRQLVARPRFTLATLLVLALAIGANTAIFSVVNGLLARPLPYPEAQRIVSVGQWSPDRSAPPSVSSVALQRLWDGAHSFEQLGAFTSLGVVWESPDGPVPLYGAVVTPSLFTLLRTSPSLGTLFTERHAVEGADRVVALSHQIWTRRFGSDQAILGAPISLNGEPHVVIAVLPESFDFFERDVDFWKPLVVRADEPPVGSATIHSTYIGVGRLREGVSAERAETEVSTILDRPDASLPLMPGVQFETRVVPFREEQVRPYRRALLMFALATALVLLMACANVGGLLLARGIVRRRELAIRDALGAGRGRIVRLLLVESVVLSVAGGALGLAVAAGLVRAVPALSPSHIPGLAEIGLDGLMLTFAAGLSLVAGGLSGAAPAMVCSRVDPWQTLGRGSLLAVGGFGRFRPSRVQAGLAVVQVALALVVVSTAGLLLRSFVARVTLDLGFDPTNVVVAQVHTQAVDRVFSGAGGQIGPEAFAEMDVALRSTAERLLLRMDRVAGLPQVNAVALASSAPMSPANSTQAIVVAGQPPPIDARDQLLASTRTVSAEYAEVMRLRVQAGRFFTDRDTAGSPLVAVVSESFARQAFGGEPAVGQRLATAGLGFPGFAPGDGARTDETWEVVGVVADVTGPPGSALAEASSSVVYSSILQPSMNRLPALGTPTIVVRTADDPEPVVPFLREVVADVDPRGRITMGTLETQLAARAAQPRFFAMCALIFGAVALLLAAFGLYGALSYAFSQRQREIGVRRALGATRGDVLRLVVREGTALVAVGAVLGLCGTVATTHLIESVLFGVTPLDPLTLAAGMTVLIAVALFACWLPARQAARIRPIEALRENT
ncbi:MAG: ABC transporter permease [Acidobacteria bacterium]|nr:ABC transporter permease [Acidobacteriota bacterium]MYJ05245.1 ABC transporter permease [Acidobacteriota bacterium]